MEQKSPTEQAKIDRLFDKWDYINSYSSAYVQRLEAVEMFFTRLDEVASIVSLFEMKLASYETMPRELDSLRKTLDDLMILEADIEAKQVLTPSNL